MSVLLVCVEFVCERVCARVLYVLLMRACECVSCAYEFAIEGQCVVFKCSLSESEVKNTHGVSTGFWLFASGWLLKVSS